jgi:hypothetical protein
MRGVQVQDLVCHSEVTEDGSEQPSITVYLHRPESAARQ